MLAQLTPVNRMLHHRHMVAVDLADADGRRRQQPIPSQRGSVFAAISRLLDLLPVRLELLVLRIGGNLLLLRLEQMDLERCRLHLSRFHQLGVMVSLLPEGRLVGHFRTLSLDPGALHGRYRLR